MLDIPFPLETLPAKQADAALKELIAECRGVTPVLLGDRDVFSTEWSEHVDVFENPKSILAEARALDTESWFANRIARRHPRRVELGAPKLMVRAASLAAASLSLPLRLFTPKPQPEDVRENPLAAELKAQLAALEHAGEGSEEDLAEMRAVIAEIEAEGVEELFPDPVDYVTPRRGEELAAGLVDATEPWESAAWLQHGAYAICAPKAVFVAHCRWLWETYGARIITASTDHIGFQMGQPIDGEAAALDVLRRFELLGATAINGDRTDGDAHSLVGAERLWVSWD